MLKIGITGQAGFIGTHLFNTIGLYPDKYSRVRFEDSFFNNGDILEQFVEQCDVIIHLAAVNRHIDPDIIYNTNVELVKKLISACENTDSRPHILFSSSTQEERDNPYGRSKREGRKLFEKWAKKNGAFFSGLIIPNVFGPFGNPYYNSVIATFCHQLNHNEEPKIEVDSELKLIYVRDLVRRILEIIDGQQGTDNFAKINEIKLKHSVAVKVSELLDLLTGFRETYLETGEIPGLDDPFRKDLFNTFQCYTDHRSFYPFRLRMNSDDRGSFVETIRLNSGGQVSFSTTNPGITRGNHFHTRKAERFAVIKGKARIEIRRIGTREKLVFELDGEQPSFVDMPVWYTHNITNTGDEELLTIFWISEKYDREDPDTWFEEV